MKLNDLLAPVNDMLGPLVKLGFATPLNFTPGLVVLEVPGRKTGQLQTLPLSGYLAYPHLVIGTVRSSSQWMKNLRAAPTAHVWVWGQRFRFNKEVETDHWIVGKIEHAPNEAQPVAHEA